MTILKIKISKPTHKQVLSNLNNELTCIYDEIQLSKNKNALFEILNQINLTLWLSFDMEMV
jgi:hypothetical protein